uniref:UDP-N-acetylglucosamine transferase subunit ALG14 n=1 Tax=Panagrolaimus sp. ES5 TaxID=591445 RepID=A0AC34GVS0_9BILA
MQFKASRKLLNPNLSENKNGNKKLCDVISAGEKVSLCAVIGSGGHTGEMSTLLLQLNSDLFIPRHYVVAETDKMGIDKVMEIEKELYAKQKNHSMKADEIFTVTKIPRSREVGQSYFSSIFTTLWAIFSSILAVWRLKPDIIICNGPGTCIPICLIAFFFDLIRLRNTRIIFVESVCRVKTLSLSGKILYTLRIADIFLVQWEDLVKLYPRAEYIGILN